MMHTAILENTKMGTFHPMPFRASPRPSEDYEVGEVCRHRSVGHLTEGLNSLEDALEMIETAPDLVYANLVISWDGEVSPHCTNYFKAV